MRARAAARLHLPLPPTIAHALHAAPRAGGSLCSRAVAAAASVAARRLHTTPATADISPKVPPKSMLASMQEREQEIALLHVEVREHLEAGKMASAAEAAARCLEATRGYYGESHPATASALNNLAYAQKQIGQFDEAVKSYEGALKAYEGSVGAQHLSTASCLSNLGLLHLALAGKQKGMQKMVHVDLARGYLEQALSVRAKLLGGGGSSEGAAPPAPAADAAGKKPLLPSITEADFPDHPVIGVSLYQLASAARQQNRHKEALSLLNQAVAMLRRTVGPKHTSTATALNNLGYLLKDMGDYAGAEAAYVEARDTRAALLGPRHPDYIAVLHNLAELKMAAGAPDAAAGLQSEILRLMGVSEGEGGGAAGSGAAASGSGRA